VTIKEGAMPQLNVNIRMDESLKREFEAVCGEMGLTMTAAFTVFAKAVSSRKEIPFRVMARPAVREITLASEKALAREWLLPEEDEAWANL
jgi:addiction module RelB/DinJ family antitoxin